MAESTLLQPRRSVLAGQLLAGSRQIPTDITRNVVRGIGRALAHALMIGAPVQGAPVTFRYDLNTATDVDLVRIPSVGKFMLREFMAGRPWTSRTQFRDHIGQFVDTDVLDLFERYLVMPDESASSPFTHCKNAEPWVAPAPGTIS